MTAAEIAETLLNGNIALARNAIINGNDAYERTEYAAAATALAVVEELAVRFLPFDDGNQFDYATALGKVRRCLEGAP